MIDRQLRQALRPVGRRLRWTRFWKGIWMAWAVAAAWGGLLWHQTATDPAAPPVTGWQVVVVGAAGSLLALLVAAGSGWRTAGLAARVEQAFPQLKQRLWTALSQQPDRNGQWGYLQRIVREETLTHAQQHRWQAAIPRSRLATFALATLPTIAVAWVLASELGWSLPREPRAARLGATGSLVKDGEVAVEPGDAEIERGSSLVVTARFGLRVPREANLVIQQGDREERLPMTRSLDDPLFAVPLERIDAALQYRVESNVATSPAFRVTVFELPALQRADAHLSFPRYTGLEKKVVEDTLRVSAVEGTELTWLFHLNKSVARGWLEREPAAAETTGEIVEFVQDSAQPDLYRVTLPLKQTARWDLHLEDDAGRRNAFPPRLVARVLPNDPPELKLASARDVRVSPLEELPLTATVEDDYGIVRAGMGYAIPGQPEAEVLLGEASGRWAAQDLTHQIDFEALNAEPDQLLSYYFWAEDFGPDGELRRTRGDLFFAEVRPFEEIFREGESPSGQSPPSPSSPQAEDAEQLAELQKQIVIASWALVRQGDAVVDSESFGEDVEAIDEAQGTAIAMLEELAGELQDPQSREFAQAAQALMQTVREQLAAAMNGPKAGPEAAALSEASATSRAAYQALLKLRDREFEVVRSQQSQSSSRSSSNASQQQMQQQLDELELKNDEDRYEAEQQAQAPQEDPLAEEMRQVLSRLSELARRQQDLNKQIQQLQLALQEAESAAEKEEMERLLKRLREQQQELLRDTDEMAERMEQSSRQNETMQQTREQLEQTRENVRKASEALQQQEASQALTAGTRAEREFEGMRESVREATAGQFNEAMQEMRQQARELAEQQDALAETLQQQEADPDVSQGLRGSPDRGKTTEAMQRQSETLQELLQQMQQTIEQSEEIEPLLAEELYESFRQSQRDQTKERLELTAELLEQGLTPQAIQMEAEARRGIERLREGVEDAAERVIGDETEALRRAAADLDRLADAVNQEMRQAAEQSPGTPSDETAGETGPLPNDPNDPGESAEGAEIPGQTPGPTPDPTPATTPGQASGQPPGEGQQPGGMPSSAGLRGEGGQAEGGGRLLDQGQWTDSTGTSPIEAPLTGEGFREWSDAMRDVEQLIEDPDLRAEATEIRERARQMRREWNRQATEPQWPLVGEMVAQPLERLRREVSAELLRRSAEKNAVVPIDRDPVPERFSEAVQDYYERLGSGR